MLGDLGKLRPPYPVTLCAAADCRCDLVTASAAYLFTDLRDGKLITFCQSCAEYVELRPALPFRRVLL